MTDFILEIERNAEGDDLAYLSVEGSGVGYRIAGPKAWGGSRQLVKLNIRRADLITFIKDFAPDLIEKLTKREIE
jgi:hypothetical protein